MVEGESRKNGDARWIAFQILSRLESEHSNSSILLKQFLQRVSDPKDRHLITELVLGVLRWRGPLLWIIQKFSKRPLDRIDPEVVVILQLGAFQLLFTGISQHAAIYETVRLCKRARLSSAASFVNGILRGMQGNLSSLPEIPSPQRYSHPEWLVTRWIARFGQEEAEALMKANKEPPPFYLCVNELVTDSATLIRKLSEENVIVERTAFGANVLIVREGTPQLSKSFLEGAFYISDAGADKLGEMIDARPGSGVLEISAAPGGKTLQIAVRMRNQGFIAAIDSDTRRMRMW